MAKKLENKINNLTYRQDIGMFCIDRPRKASCIYATSFCLEECYNCKLNRAFKFEDRPSELKLEDEWQAMTGENLSLNLDGKRKFTDRVRFASRGECLKDKKDFTRVHDICQNNPDRLFWLPSRSWRAKKKLTNDC